MLLTAGMCWEASSTTTFGSIAMLHKPLPVHGRVVAHYRVRRERVLVRDPAMLEAVAEEF